ncbi:MAG TPA: universal stress protein [Nocardioidaceae bacterium]|nr:universal stress protein [Nocardioidaceae bacterium]
MNGPNATPPIVVGLDRTPAGSAALRWAAREALRSGARVHAVQVYDRRNRADLALVVDHDEERTRERIRGHCQLLDVLGPRVADQCVVYSQREGDLAEQLLEAGRDAAVVVVGAPSCSQTRTLVESLREHSDCPVVVVDEWGAAHPFSDESVA